MDSFGEGDMVRVTVDRDAGTLGIRVNGGEPHEVFTGMPQVVDAKVVRPAVSLTSNDENFESGYAEPGRTRLLTFGRVKAGST